MIDGVFQVGVDLKLCIPLGDQRVALRLRAEDLRAQTEQSAGDDDQKPRITSLVRPARFVFMGLASPPDRGPGGRSLFHFTDSCSILYHFRR